MSRILLLSQTGELEGYHLLKRLAFAVLFALLGSAGVRAEECSRFAIQVATTPVPYQHPHGLERTAALLSKIPDRADMIMIGDSLIEFWLPQVTKKQFQSDRIWNIGVGGGETQNTLWELDQFDGAALKPSRLFVLIGTNNLTHDFMPACAIAAGVKAVVAAAHAKWPAAKIDVMGIAPRGEDFRFRDDVRLVVNAEVQAWSSNYGYLHFFEADPAAMTCGQYDTPLQVADASGEPVIRSHCANYTDDSLHFKRGGYDVIFSSLTKG
jgi:lysophospholipase L1-like esterase